MAVAALGQTGGDHAIELFKADLRNDMGNLGRVNAEELAVRLTGD